MKLTIIVPVHNEAKTLPEVLRRLQDVNLPNVQKEIIAVNDGSTDNSGEMLNELANRYGFKALHHLTNFGKGKAIATALKSATGDYVLIQDADLEYDPGDIPNLLSLILNGEEKVAAVFGARGTKRYPERGFHYVVGAKLLTWAFNVVFGTHLTDLYTGYKLVKAAYIKDISYKSQGFEIEVEIAATIVKKGGTIKEASIRYNPRNKDQGKHIKFWDAWRGFAAIIKMKLNH